MIEKIKTVLPLEVYKELQEVIDKFQINTAKRLSHFLAQVAHESGDFKFKVENLNYSGERLKIIFPKYFKTIDVSIYHRQPVKIANLVYANRMGNGSEQSGEGFLYRGRGFIQLTGKNNYSEFDKVVTDDILNNPDLVATKYPLLSAGWFWNKNNLNSIADKGIDKTTIIEVTKRVNGGTHGIEDRILKFNKFYNLLK